MTRAPERILAAGAKPSVAASGFRFTEGPVWSADRGSLVFSDIPANAMYRLRADGVVEDYRRPSNFANGSTRDNQGRLVTCEHGTSRVVRQEPDGRLTVLASHWQGRELNSPNDVIVDRQGAVWFTDPIYGRMGDYGVERPPELDFKGVYCLTPDGALHLVADDFDQPNGLCLSLDETTLYVADTRRFHLRRFDVAAPGRVSGGEVFAQTLGDAPGCPDGLKIDSTGRLFSTGPGGIQVFRPDGTLIGVIGFPEEAINFTWGGADLCTLYVAAHTSLYSVRLTCPGLPVPISG